MVTRILFDPRRDLTDGTITSSPVTLEATPTGIREDGSVVILPTTLSFTVNTGADIVQLPAPAASWSWRIVVRQDGQVKQQRTVRFADVPSIAYQDLTDVDPASLGETTGHARQWDATFFLIMQALANIAIEAGGGKVTSVSGRTGAVVLTKTDVGLDQVDNTSDPLKPISTAQAAALAAKADLVGGKIPTAQIPALALTSTQVVASQAAMLALTNVEPGDIAIRTDGAGSYILVGSDPTQLASWVRLNAPTDVVQSVNGKQGTVVLSAADVGADVAGAAAAITLAGLGGVTQTQVDSRVTALADPLGAATAAAAASSPSGVSAGEGVTKQHAIPRWVTTPWNPFTKPYQAEPDTLFLPGGWTSENDVLAVGGRLAYGFDTYYAAASAKATLSAGKYGTPLVTGNAQGAYMVLPLDGVIAADQFTIETSIVSVGADFTAQPFTTTYGFLAFDGTGAQNEGIILRRTAATTLTVVFQNGVTNATANLTIASGDIPADTETGVEITYDGTTLTLILGNGTKTATATGSVSYGSFGSSEHQLGGLLVNPGTGGTTIAVAGTPSNVWKVAVPHVRRYKRTLNAQAPVLQQGVLVDATIPGTAFPVNLLGIMSQYYGWKDNLPDGAGGLGTSIRDQAIAAAGAAGVPFTRIDHVFDKVTVVDNGSGATPRYTISDWSALDVPMDKWVAANPSIGFHITLGYTPAVLGATRATPPSDNTAFGSLCVQAVAHWLAKGYKLVALSLWNEPGNSVFWTGTTTQMQALWQATQSALNTAYGANALVPKLGTSDGATTADMQAQGIAGATANGTQVGSYHFHDYSGQARNLRNNIATAKTQLSAAGMSSAGVWITEWNDNQNVLAQIYTTPNSLATRIPDRVYRTRHAALTHSQVVEMAAAGAYAAAFERLSVLDDAYAGIERTLGLFTADDPIKPLPAFAAFWMMWKLGGQSVPTSSTAPGVKTLASWDATGKKLTAVIGSYAPALTGQASRNVAVQWMNLPAAFTWKMWRFTDNELADGRARLVSVGTQANLPQGIDMPANALYCIQVTCPTGLAGTFSPDTVTPWAINLDARNITGLSDGASVASWPDVGTNNVALTQGTTSAQPVYKTNIVNGKPVVRFTSTSSQTMVGAYASEPLSTTAYTVVAVIYSNNSDGVFSQFRRSTDGGTAIKGHLRGANIRTLQRNDANVLVQPASPVTNNGVWEVVSLVWDGSTVTLRVNGKVATSTAATGTITTNRLYLGSDNGSGTFLSGDITKFLATGSVLSATDLKHTEQALGALYNIPISS